MYYFRIAVIACSHWPLHSGCPSICSRIGRKVHPIAVSTCHGGTKGSRWFDPSIVDIQVFEVSVDLAINLGRSLVFLSIIFIVLASKKASSLALKAALIAQNITSLDGCGNNSLGLYRCSNFLRLCCAVDALIQVGTRQALGATKTSSLT